METLKKTLTEIMQKEIEDLPKHLEALEPKDRLDIIIKLMPYSFPKIIAAESHESESWQL